MLHMVQTQVHSLNPSRLLLPPRGFLFSKSACLCLPCISTIVSTRLTKLHFHQKIVLPYPFQSHTVSIPPTLFFLTKQSKNENHAFLDSFLSQQEFSFHTSEAFPATRKLTPFCSVLILFNYSPSSIFRSHRLGSLPLQIRRIFYILLPRCSSEVFRLPHPKIMCVCMKLVLTAMNNKYLKARN